MEGSPFQTNNFHFLEQHRRLNRFITFRSILKKRTARGSCSSLLYNTIMSATPFFFSSITSSEVCRAQSSHTWIQTGEWLQGRAATAIPTLSRWKDGWGRHAVALELDHQCYQYHQGQTWEAGEGGWVAPWRIPHLPDIAGRSCAQVMEVPQIQLRCRDFRAHNPVQFKDVFQMKWETTLCYGAPLFRWLRAKYPQ